MGDYSDSSNNLQFLFKKSLGIVSTFKDTAFYNEIARRFKTPVKTEDVNIETAPTLPVWEASSDNSVFNLGSDDFASVDFTELHTYDSTYTKNGTKTPGMYLDISGIVALFVRLKLDKMEGDATTNLDDSAIVYTKYPTDSSNISLMDSAYQFNYNSQINVNSSIPVFKPYNYTLEYSSDDSTFYQVTNDMGNWSFDTNSGTIIFEDDPSLNNNIIDLSNGDLYFTFVKYVGLQGIQNLIYHDSSGHSGIGTKDPQSELDISGSMRITKDLTLTEDLYVTLTDVLHVDSTNKTVSIGLDTANYSASGDLHVVGDTEITGTLNIGSGIGPGMCPIGTIIIWVKNTPPSGYGTWLLCNGQSCTDYTSLQAIVGDNVPNLTGSYSRGGPIGSENNISYGGSNTTNSITLAAANLPEHGHEGHDHGHTITVAQHRHPTNISHAHEIAAVNSHTHEINAHTHNIDDSNTNHTHNANAQHAHNVTTISHGHATNHEHNDVDVSHSHVYEYFNDFGINVVKRGNEASNLIDNIEKRIGGNELNTGNANVDGSANCSQEEFQTNNSTCNIATSNLNSTTVDLDSGQVYSSDITTNFVGADSNNSTWNVNPSVDDSAVTCVDAGIKVTLGNVNQSNHNVSGTSGTNYGVSFNFDGVNLSCVEIFYYIRAE